MTPETIDRLFNFRNAFDHTMTVIVTSIIAVAVVVSPLGILVANRGRPADDPMRRELWLRYRSWLVLIPLMIGPVLLGAAWTILAVLILALLCFAEFSYATGLFRHKAVSLTVLVGIVATTFAALDHWPGLFAALIPIVVVLILAIALAGDQPKGYIQRSALGVMAFLLFGVGLVHLALVADDINYRPMILLLLLAVEMNDVFAFISGKLIGGPKLVPHTSPNKTIAGSLGAIVLTTLLIVVVGHFGLRYTQTPLRFWPHLVAIGIIVSVAGQLGDLMMSAIKRDIGVKDIGQRIPGHGGLLDRFDSLLLVTPAIYHYVNFFHETNIGADQPQRILTSIFGG